MGAMGAAVGAHGIPNFGFLAAKVVGKTEAAPTNKDDDKTNKDDDKKDKKPAFNAYAQPN